MILGLSLPSAFKEGRRLVGAAACGGCQRWESNVVLERVGFDGLVID